ncbi:hypothetical protein GQ44DRAFT_682282 [Phaeosphaeriaceae sp. PMI808]|nr:hypothetical protein GQ44DRAFT_682282 [Phaeosphaeriaceae sp. PMI808]
MPKEYPSAHSLAHDTCILCFQKDTLAVQIDNSWETRALKSIKRKALSLDRQWTETTWHNKSSIEERLKLLKDDGVDIVPLQGPKVCNKSITQAVIAQIKARQRPQSTAGEPHKNQYQPLPSRSLKRKRLVDHMPLHEREPLLKKLCKTDLRLKSQIEEIQLANIYSWDVLKHKVLSTIFKDFNEDMHYPNSFITIYFPSQSKVVDVLGDMSLNSKGYENVLKELRALSANIDEDGTIGIHNPEKPGQRINVFTNVPLQVTIEGNLEDLRILLCRLMSHGNSLMHMEKRYFDETETRRGSGEVFELSTKTQEELRNIYDALTRGSREGNMNVKVRWTDEGTSGRWKQQMS